MTPGLRLSVCLVLVAAPAAHAQDSGRIEAREGTPCPVHRALPADPLDVPQPPKVFLPALPHHEQPPLPAGTNPRPQPDCPPTEPRSATSFGPQAAGDFKVFLSIPVQPAGASRNFVCEPATSISRDTAFCTGNWFAALSKDSGMTWTHIDPYTRFPASDGGFCCDQRTIHLPSIDVTIWFLQYQYDGILLGRHRLAWARGRDELRSDTWNYVDFLPPAFGFTLPSWFDYPNIAYGSTHLYLSSTVYAGGGGSLGDVVWRIPLVDLQGTGPLHFTYVTDATLGGALGKCFTLGATNTMYFATHQGTSTLRVYVWPENSSSISWYDRNVAAWSGTTFTAPAPDGRDWLGEHTTRIQGAYATPTEIGFLWGCGNNPVFGRPFPYVRVERYTAFVPVLIGEHDIWNPNLAFHYPSAAPDSRNHVGGVLAYGGSTQYPSIVGYLVDDFQSTWAPLDAHVVRVSSNGPGNNAWGHFFTTNTNALNPNTWIATGLTIQGGTTRASMEPRYLWFGRERDEPAWVTVTVQAPGSGGAVPINVLQTDRLGRSDNVTPFTLSYAPHQGYALTAPLQHSPGSQSYVFDHWEVNGNPRTLDDRSLVVNDIGTTNDLDQAFYVPVRSLAVHSTNPTAGVPILVNVLDIHGNAAGQTPFTRDFKDGQQLQLTAQPNHGPFPFKQWVVDGNPRPLGNTTIAVTMGQDHAAVAEHYQHTTGTFTTIGSGCQGSNGVLSHLGGGTPEIGLATPTTFLLYNGPINSVAILVTGVSSTSWNGIPLPVDLTPLGYPGCSIYTDLVVATSRGTDGLGRASVAVFIPGDTTLIGGHLYTQYWGIDLPATLRFSNGLDTMIGGYR